METLKEGYIPDKAIATDLPIPFDSCIMSSPIKSHFPPVYFTGGLCGNNLKWKMRTENPTRARRASLSDFFDYFQLG